MDVDNYLKNFLNKDGHIKNENLEKIIPQLKLIITPKLKDKKLKKENIKKILHDSLIELGWSKEQVLKLSKPKGRNKKKNTSSGWNKIGQSKIIPKTFQGGSPGLGKGKS